MPDKLKLVTFPAPVKTKTYHSPNSRHSRISGIYLPMIYKNISTAYKCQNQKIIPKINAAFFINSNSIQQLYYKVPRYTGKPGMPALPCQAVAEIYCLPFKP